AKVAHSLAFVFGNTPRVISNLSSSVPSFLCFLSSMRRASSDDGFWNLSNFLWFLIHEAGCDLLAAHKTLEHIPVSASSHTKWILGSIAGAGVALFSQELLDATLTVGGRSIAILFACMLALQSVIQNREHRIVLPAGTT